MVERGRGTSWASPHSDIMCACMVQAVLFFFLDGKGKDGRNHDDDEKWHRWHSIVLALLPSQHSKKELS